MFWGERNLPSGKLTWQWKMNQLKMYSLLKMGIFHGYVSLPGGIISLMVAIVVVVVVVVGT